MADARSEQIIAAIKALLIGLTTTGANVQRGQVYEHEAAKLPALSLYMGSDVPAGEHQTGLIDWDLSVNIVATVSVIAAYTANESLVDRDLNQIRKEVHAVMMADYTLGLAFVIDVAPGIAAEPVLSGESATPHGSQSIEYIISYRTSRADISA